MNKTDETKRELIGKNRLESLTDGIFAFSMTLLVTSMILPRSAIVNQTSGVALTSLLPDFYHYIIAFFVLAGFWVGHHEQLSKINHLDRNLLLLNVIGLFFVTLVPFSTSFIGDYSNDVIATVVFEMNLLILGLIFAIQWYYATRNYHLISKGYPESAVRRRMHRQFVIPAISLLGILITILGFDNSTMIYLASPLVEYAVDRYA